MGAVHPDKCRPGCRFCSMVESFRLAQEADRQRLGTLDGGADEDARPVTFREFISGGWGERAPVELAPVVVLPVVAGDRCPTCNGWGLINPRGKRYRRRRASPIPTWAVPCPAGCQRGEEAA